MEVNSFQILLNNVIYHLYQASKLICNVLIKNVKNNYGRHLRLRGWINIGSTARVCLVPVCYYNRKRRRFPSVKRCTFIGWKLKKIKIRDKKTLCFSLMIPMILYLVDSLGDFAFQLHRAHALKFFIHNSVQNWTVWGRARYPSVTEAFINI